MKLSGTLQEHNNNQSSGSNIYVSPSFGSRNQKMGNDMDDQLIEPDSEIERNYMDPYEMGEHSEDVDQNDNLYNQGIVHPVSSNRSQSNNHKREQDQKYYLNKNQEYQGLQVSSNRSDIEKPYDIVNDYDEQLESNQINLNHLQKMSSSLNEFLKKQNCSLKSTNSDNFNFQDDSIKQNNKNQENEEDFKNGSSSFLKLKVNNSQKNTESNPTKFYQMNKMRSGEQLYKEKTIEIQDESQQQENQYNSYIEQEKYKNPRQTLNDENNINLRANSTQKITSNYNNQFEETQPRQLKSVPAKEPSKFSSKINTGLTPMKMKDMVELSLARQQQNNGQPYYQDVKDILNNKFDDDQECEQKQQEAKHQSKFISLGKEQNKGINYFAQQRYQSKQTKQKNKNGIESQSFNCSPKQKNNSFIDKIELNKQQSERKMKQVEEFLQNDNKIDKVDLKKILQGDTNTSRISKKDDPLVNQSNVNLFDIEIEIVSEKIKNKLLSWLNDIKLLKQIPNLDKKLPKICKDGIIFADIINLIEGKIQIIKGLERKPKKDSQITANYIKIFNYLKNFDKMNPRYLSQQLQIQQNENIFWGFLDDLWYFYQNKISPNDIRYHKNSGSTQNQNNSYYSAKNTINQNKPLVKQYSSGDINNIRTNNNENQSTRRSNSQIPKNNSNKALGEEDFEQQNSQNQDNMCNTSTTNLQSRRNKSQNYEDIIHDNHNEAKRKRSGQRSNKDLNQNLKNTYDLNAQQQEEEEQYNINFQLQQDKYLNSKGQNNTILKPSQKIDIEVIKIWLRNIGFSHMLRKSELFGEQYNKLRQQENDENIDNENQADSLQILNKKKNKTDRNQLRKKYPNDKLWGAHTQEEEKIIIQDPIKNGVLLSLILSRVEICRVDSMHRQPESIEQCYKNYDLVYRSISSRNLLIPTEFLWKQKQIFQGELFYFWQVCNAIMMSTNNQYISNSTEGQEDIIPQISNQTQINSFYKNPPIIQNYNSHNFPSFGADPQNKRNKQNNSGSFGNNINIISNKFMNNAEQQANLQQITLTNQLNVTNSVIHTNQTQQLTVNLVLPYSEESVERLKTNIIDWVEQMGIFAEMNVDCNDFITFLNLCKDGAVLCYILSHIFKMKIVGVNRKSCTKVTSISNIRKFLEIFKRTKGLPNIFFVTEEAIYDQKEHLILYLLEELMRYQDNIPSRSNWSLFEEPYLKQFPNKNNIFQRKQNSEQAQTYINQQQDQQNPYYPKGQGSQSVDKPSVNNQSNRDLLKNHNENLMNLIRDDNYDNEQLNVRNSKINNNSSLNQPKIDRITGQIKLQQPNYNNNNQMTSFFIGNKHSSLLIEDPYSIVPSSKRVDNFELNTITSPINAQVIQIQNGYFFDDYYNKIQRGFYINPQQQQTQTQRIDQIIQKNQIINSKNNTSQTIKTDGGDNSAYYDHGNSDRDYDTEELNIINWLTSIGFDDLAYSLNFKQQTIPQFKDGTILCKILEKVEGKYIKGVNVTPKTTAHCKFNIKKCIELLEKKPEMNQDLLWDEDLFYDCKPEFMKAFLIALRHTYRKVTKSIKRQILLIIKNVSNILQLKTEIKVLHNFKPIFKNNDSLQMQKFLLK